MYLFQVLDGIAVARTPFQLAETPSILNGSNLER
jgi:hypothetical protein